MECTRNQTTFEAMINFHSCKSKLLKKVIAPLDKFNIPDTKSMDPRIRTNATNRTKKTFGLGFFFGGKALKHTDVVRVEADQLLPKPK